MKVLNSNVVEIQVKKGDFIKYISRSGEVYWGIIIDNSTGTHVQNLDGFGYMYKGSSDIEDLNNKINHEKGFTFEFYPSEEYAIRLEKIS